MGGEGREGKVPLWMGGEGQGAETCGGREILT